MERFAVNIKRSRTKISPETVNEYFDSLESGIPPTVFSAMMRQTSVMILVERSA